MLSLSTDAAPRRSLDELHAACQARGLDGVELVIPLDDDPASVLARAKASHARIIALRIERLDEATAPTVARCAAELDVPLSAPYAEVDPLTLPRVAAVFAEAGARLLLGHRSKLDEAVAVIAAIPPSVGLAWEIHPAPGELAEASAILLATRERLGAVRLYGGGPEQRDQDGFGVGPLFVELALSGFAGPIILCPSGPERVERWTRWLGARGSSGCGHVASTKAIHLDVRDVEPRHRLETILGAYRALVPGATLYLTVDHDPVCMYYTLEATEPEHSFSFEIVEHGPEVWRAVVTRR